LDLLVDQDHLSCLEDLLLARHGMDLDPFLLVVQDRNLREGPGHILLFADLDNHLFAVQVHHLFLCSQAGDLWSRLTGKICSNGRCSSIHEICGVSGQVVANRLPLRSRLEEEDHHTVPEAGC